jgi:hypothetical protein
MFIETEQLKEKILFEISLLSYKKRKDKTNEKYLHYIEYLNAIKLTEKAEQEIYPHKYKK